MKMEEVYEHLFGEKANQTHRAMDDVKQLLRIFRQLVADEVITL
jgi:inhibitor of KinA sporulation pathway (predicted exonuclease)